MQLRSERSYSELRVIDLQNRYISFSEFWVLSEKSRKIFIVVIITSWLFTSYSYEIYKYII